MKWLLLTIVLAAVVRALGPRWLAPRPDTPPPLDPDIEAMAPVPIDDELDLHGVSPDEIETVVDAFIGEACTQRRARVKIIHGKGIGVLRRRVRALLARDPRVDTWSDAATPGSGRGATVVQLRDSALAVPPTPD